MYKCLFVSIIHNALRLATMLFIVRSRCEITSKRHVTYCIVRILVQ